MTDQMIERVTARLAQLWSEDPNPLQAMTYAALRMAELGLMFETPDRETDPKAFAKTLVSDNPALLSHLRQNVLIEFNPKAIETPDEMLSLLLPGPGSE